LEKIKNIKENNGGGTGTTGGGSIGGGIVPGGNGNGVPSQAGGNQNGGFNPGSGNDAGPGFGGNGNGSANSETIDNPDLGIRRSIAVSHNSMGNIYLLLKQYDLAIQQFNKSQIIRHNILKCFYIAIWQC